MPWDRRRQGDSAGPPAALRRPSNPTSLAKTVAPPPRAREPVRPPRGKKRGRAGAAPGPLPASVTLSVSRVLRGEVLALEDGGSSSPERGSIPADEGARWGVLYRLVVLDADGKPIPPRAYTIRRHLLHLASAGCFAAREKSARIDLVTLDAESGAFDFLGLPDAELGAAEAHADRRSGRGAEEDAGEERLLEYFSFEMAGVTVAIPRSGFLRARTRRGGRLEIVRTPRASGSVHGAVVPGLLGDGGGDTYVLAVRG